MAIYHFDLRPPISRSAGRSATASAAYRAGERIEDARTGEVFDYTRRKGVEHCELVLPEAAPAWARDRAKLWNAAEGAEKRKDGVVAREIILALPHELDAEQRVALARAFAGYLVARHGVAVDVAIHEAGRGGDERNSHAHLLMTTRRLGPEGLGEKTRELDVKATGRGHITAWRQEWAREVNQSLERAGREERVDCRSHAARGEDREALLHLGPAAAALERRGETSRIGEENREREERNRARPSPTPERATKDGQPTAERVTELWRGADSGAAFAAGLAGEGWTLCRGDRRPFVLVDGQGKTHNVARLIEGVKTGEVRERLKGLDLPSVEQVRTAEAGRLDSVRQAPVAEASGDRGASARMSPRRDAPAGRAEKAHGGERPAETRGATDLRHPSSAKASGGRKGTAETTPLRQKTSAGPTKPPIRATTSTARPTPTGGREPVGGMGKVANRVVGGLADRVSDAIGGVMDFFVGSSAPPKKSEKEEHAPPEPTKMERHLEDVRRSEEERRIRETQEILEAFDSRTGERTRDRGGGRERER